jgi:putative transposase
MPRPPRHILAGECYHVINRANRKAEVFHSSADYSAFLKLMARAQEHVEVAVIAACLMPNHVHFIIRSNQSGDITRWMKWLMTTHAVHYNMKYGKTGHVWQGRFKSFPVQTDQYLLALMRYVERNAMRAKLVNRAEQWPWGSLRWRARGSSVVTLTAPPIELPLWWVEFVNLPQTVVELAEIRTSVNRQRPLGDEDWVARRAKLGAAEQTLRNVGRPRKRQRSGTIS